MYEMPSIQSIRRHCRVILSGTNRPLCSRLNESSVLRWMADHPVCDTIKGRHSDSKCRRVLRIRRATTEK